MCAIALAWIFFDINPHCFENLSLCSCAPLCYVNHFYLLPHRQNINKAKAIYLAQAKLDKSILKTEGIPSSKLSLHPDFDTQRNLFILGRITTLNYVKASTSVCDAWRPKIRSILIWSGRALPCVELLCGEHSFTASLWPSLWIHQRADDNWQGQRVWAHTSSRIFSLPYILAGGTWLEQLLSNGWKYIRGMNAGGGRMDHGRRTVKPKIPSTCHCDLPLFPNTDCTLWTHGPVRSAEDQREEATFSLSPRLPWWSVDSDL